MAKIKMVGWLEGLDKVALSKLQVEELQIPLKKAKDNVDSLLEGKEVVIYVDNMNEAKKFVVQAERIGTVCEIQE